jgi:cell division protein FtsB
LHTVKGCFILVLMSIPAQLKYIVFTLLFTIATVNLVRTTLNILHSSQRLEDLKTEVSKLETKRSKMEDIIEYKKTDEFIEERARNALNLIKPGEKVFVMPVVLAASSEKTVSTVVEKEKSNFELWLELFL